VPRSTQRADTRGAILGVALELFLAQGYEATSLRQIAEQLDVTTAALYYHFPAKEEILWALVQPFIEGTEEILKLAKGESPEHLLEMYLEVILRDHKVAHLLVSDPAAASHPEIGPRRQRVFSQLEAHVAGPGATEEDRARAQCAIQVVRTIAFMPSERARRTRGVVFRSALAVLASR